MSVFTKAHHCTMSATCFRVSMLSMVSKNGRIFTNDRQIGIKYLAVVAYFVVFRDNLQGQAQIHSGQDS
jgi:hypothetical protein